MKTKYLLNPLCANLAYTHPELFSGRNARGMPKRRRKVNPAKQKKTLLSRFKKYKLKSMNAHITPGEYVAQKPPFDIDIVFTWVNNTTDHSKKRRYWLEKTKKNGIVSSDNEINRYGNNDELRYAIRSVYKYAPWVRCVFIVVDDQQYPEWLMDTSAEAKIPVCIVPHSLLYGQEFRHHLPTFNSQSIECHLYKIPNLAEQFIYFNDDMFFGNYTQWSDFFNADGLPRYVYTGVVATGKKISTMNKWTMAWINNGNLLNRIFPQFSKEIRKYQCHQGCPLLKSSFVKMWQHPRIHKYLARTSESKFREPHDLYPIGFMVYFNKYMNLSDVHRLNTFYTQITDNMKPENEFRVLLEQGPTLFCINDGVLKRRKAQGAVLKIFLDFYFPDPSPVEKVTQMRIEDEFHNNDFHPQGLHNASGRSQVQVTQKFQPGHPFL